jgi:hypothetical protein
MYAEDVNEEEQPEAAGDARGPSAPHDGDNAKCDAAA